MSNSAESNIVKLATSQEVVAIAEPLTEDSTALAFAERHRDQLLFDHDIGKWFVWTGTRWQCERTCLAFSWARDLARELAEKAPSKVRLITSKAAFAGNVERFARADRACAVTSDIWDSDGYLLGTPAGTVDLRTGELREAQPDDFITKATAVAPAETAACPRWMQFLNEATLLRPPVVIEATQEYFEAQDTIRHWIEERCETGKGLADTSANLFRSWSTWANANGEPPRSNKWFAQVLRRLNFKPHRKNKARGFFGIEAKPEPVGPHWSERGEQ